MDIRNVEAAVLELLNEALALEPSAMNALMLRNFVTAPGLLAHRQSMQLIGTSDVAVTALSLTNAYLKKLGSNHHIKPIYNQHGPSLSGFVLEGTTPASASDVKPNAVPKTAESVAIPEDHDRPTDVDAQRALVSPAGGWTTASSKNIKRYQYDDDNMEMWVEFNTGRTYVYSGVPIVVYDAFMAAPSQGSFLNQSIKGTYGVREVPTEAV